VTEQAPHDGSGGTADAHFDAKVALVTGGATGIGAGVSRRLAALGARVVVADIAADAGCETAAAVGGRFVRCDVREPADSQAAVDAAVEAYGGLDVAFCNAGVSTGCGLADFDAAAYQRARAVNLDGVVYGAAAALPALVARGGGELVLTASLAGLTATPFDPIYGATKHGVVGLTRALGPAYAEQGVHVNALCPGFADTAIVDELRDWLAEQRLSLLTVDEVVDAFLAVLASGRTGQCFYVQPGRPSEPFRFRRLPGPRRRAASADA
jgi:NAD(P)-dependent dehydrogenase (short-subunit alcohol dehydrogenase family)